MYFSKPQLEIMLDELRDRHLTYLEDQSFPKERLQLAIILRKLRKQLQK